MIMVELTSKEISQLKSRSEAFQAIEAKWQTLPACECGGEVKAYLFAETHCKAQCQQCFKKSQHGEIK